MQLSVITVSYNVKYFLEQCLYSLLAACKNTEAEIIVIDNASSDNSINYLQSKFPQVNFINNEINEGFAKANNKALSAAKGKYILYLNPDTILSEDVISNCISFLEEHNEAGAAGVKMIDGNGNFLPESKRAFPSVITAFFKLSGMAALFKKSAVFNKYALGNLDENKIHEADVLSGAFFLSRKEILFKLNGFDEDFFMYGEDIDLSYRIIKAGYKNYYLGNNVIIHFKGESTKNDKAYLKNFYGAMKIFVDKHHKSTSSSLLKASINASAFISSTLKATGHLFSPVEKENADKNFLLVGDKEATASAAAILQAGNYLYKVFIIADDEFSTADFQYLMESNELLKKLPSKSNIVCCLNKLSYSKCIGITQANKNKFLYYWHYKDSGSIISGSNNAAIPQIYITI